MIALCAGLVFGANYMGVDLKGIAAGTLKSASIAAPEWLSDAEPPALGLTAEGVVEPAPAAVDAQSPASPSAESVAPPSADPAPAEPVTPETARQRQRDSLGYLVPLTSEQKAVLTRAYWDELATIMAAERASREASIDNVHELQLFDYLTDRKNAHGAAVAAIEELDSLGVDPQVKSFAEKVLAWHEEGQALFARAIALLTNAPTAQLTGPFAQSWQSAAKQHRMEERLVLEKRTAVQTLLDHELAGTTAASAAPTSRP
ncbi:MAG: hypothetical protein KF688_17315 [Pirellulales bacterium]|nr:hypothetical protein [Pirellulales bacterium]